eukprot:snap_masked-scaffold_14-processed-gene-8.17-mRNA-1 protein AED:1.00 eAED:1.00 QI:0/-1/0/0/-1/1/1/0/102
MNSSLLIFLIPFETRFFLTFPSNLLRLWYLQNQLARVTLTLYTKLILANISLTSMFDSWSLTRVRMSFREELSRISFTKNVLKIKSTDWPYDAMMALEMDTV